MSSIFNQSQINCAILGPRKNAAPRSKFPCSVILLGNGNAHLREQNIQCLFDCGFEKIICVEKKNYGIESLSQKFPEAQFIIPLELAADGDLINAAMAQIASPYALVIRDCVRIKSQILTSQLFQSLCEKEIFCVVPRLFSREKTSLPSQFIPSVKKSVLQIESSLQVSDGIATLYPFNFLGFYDVKKFKRLCGYDGKIKNSYWQNLDLAFRSWLWGEKIKIATGFSLSYAEEIPAEDSTPDISQLRFFLKNMAPVLKEGRAEIPLSKFVAFKLRSSCGIFEAARQFNSARTWVKENERRFLLDAFTLINEWGRG